jgi:hypothetical protein
MSIAKISFAGCNGAVICSLATWSKRLRSLSTVQFYRINAGFNTEVIISSFVNVFDVYLSLSITGEQVSGMHDFVVYN